MKVRDKLILGSYETQILNKNELRGILYEASAANIQYIDTAITYNNDYIYADADRFKLISKIAPHMLPIYDFVIDNHLKNLNRSRIHLMLIHNPRSNNWEDLSVRLEKDNRFDHVGVSNFSIEQLNRYKEVNGHYPEYNEMEINPSYYDEELIQFCVSNGIKLIAYCVLGGKYEAQRMISNYTLPLLLNLAAEHCEHIIIRPDSRTQLMDYLVASHTEIDNPSSIIKKQLHKLMVPTHYEIPVSAYSLINGVAIPTYSKYNTDGIGVRSQNLITLDELADRDSVLGVTMKELIDSVGRLEFITEYRMLLRYAIQSLGWHGVVKPLQDDMIYTNNCTCNIYLVDRTHGALTKVNQNADVMFYYE